MRRKGNSPRERRASGRDVRSQRRAVEGWNAIAPGSGHLVDVRLDSGEIKRTITASSAELLSGHTAVIWLDGVTGCYELSRVTLIARIES